MGVRKVEKETRYELNKKYADSLFSCFAIWNLLPEDNRPDKILFLLTPRAKESAYSKIVMVAEDHGIEIGFIKLPSEEVVDDSAEFLRLVANAIPQGSQLTIDVTQGLRHHAFLFYALAVYLGEFRETEILGAWYCRYETGTESKPFIDLMPVLDLYRWFHALGVLRETGSLNALSKLVNCKNKRNPFEMFSSLFLTGMPIEAGVWATTLVERIESDSELLPEMPLIDEIKRKIIDELNLFSGGKISKRWKTSLPLTDKELHRQAAYIDKYLATEQLNLAFGLMREWVINKILLTNNKSEWLNRRGGRLPIEHMLGGLRKVFETKSDPVQGLLSDEHSKWAELWDKLTNVRNMLQHHGMNPDEFKTDNGSIKYLRRTWPELQKWPIPPSFGGGAGKLLISPLGQSPGVFYSALKIVQPDRCMVICSNETRESITKACEQAEWSGSIEYLVMENPHTGFDEFKKKLKRKASIWLFEADEIHAGLTGGTSLMGALVGELAYLAGRNYQRDVRKFVLIDKRSPVKQRESPWEIGEICYLEDSRDKEAQ
jgi:hypothetical protein